MEKEKIIPMSHDRFFKLILSDKNKFIQFLKAYFPKHLLEKIDINNLKIEKDSFVEQKLQCYFSDLLYSSTAKVKYKKVFIYFLIEHQSYYRKFIPLKLLNYRLKLYELFINQYPKAKKLPIIISIFVNHTGRVSKMYPEFIEIVSKRGGEFKDYIENFKFILIDLAKERDEKLLEIDKLGAFLLLMKHIYDKDIEFFIKFFKEIAFKYLKKEEDIELAILYTLSGARKVPTKQLFKAIKSIGGAKVKTIAEMLIKKGKKEGKKEGKIEGLKITISDLLEIKFGKESTKLMKKINKIKNLDELNEIRLKIKKCSSLEELINYIKVKYS